MSQFGFGGRLSGSGIPLHGHFDPSTGGKDLSPDIVQVQTALSSLGTLDVAALAAFLSDVNFGGQLQLSSIFSPSISANQNNYAIDDLCNILFFDVNGARRTISGISASGTPTNGRIFLLGGVGNAGGDCLRLTNEDAASTAGNRFSLPNALSLDIPNGGFVLVSRITNPTNGNTRWWVIGSFGSSSSAFTTPEFTPVLTGAVTDWAPAGLAPNTTIFADCGGVARNINSIDATGFAIGDSFYLGGAGNAGGNTLILVNNAGVGTAAWKISGPANANFNIPNVAFVRMMYLNHPVSGLPTWFVLRG